jgi:hypothetical protein
MFPADVSLGGCDCAGGVASGVFGSASRFDGNLFFAGREELLCVSPVAVGSGLALLRGGSAGRGVFATCGR